MRKCEQNTALNIGATNNGQKITWIFTLNSPPSPLMISCNGALLWSLSIRPAMLLIKVHQRAPYKPPFTSCSVNECTAVRPPKYPPREDTWAGGCELGWVGAILDQPAHCSYSTLVPKSRPYKQVPRLSASSCDTYSEIILMPVSISLQFLYVQDNAKINYWRNNEDKGQRKKHKR